MQVEFKYASINDLPKIVATYNSTVASRIVTADLEPVSVESKMDWFNNHNQNKRPLWIVTIDGEYAGWMSFNSFYGRPAYDGTVEVSIYLEEKSRGKGLGNICLQKAIDFAPSLEIKNLLGYIFGHNGPSLNLFYKFGFQKWAHLPGIANMDGILRDLIIVGKKLS
ncbi:MAG: N-acetyltransferase family protein [Bacteroidota bacterium]|nr:N-acetyltransferase family protein [Bacteroidota bacterium]MDP3145019.1 N-acetyltransferase family protein [Bacteroidota bacterium]